MSLSAYQAALEAALRAVQLSVPYASRNILVEIIRGVMRDRGLAPRFVPNPALAGGLNEDGVQSLDPLLTPGDAEVVLSYLERCSVYSSHIASRSDGIPRKIDEARRVSPLASYRLEDLVRTPRLLDIANDPKILSIAETYLGCIPTIYSMNAVWTFPSFAPGEVQTQFFHRDNDDFKFCTLFIILTESTRDNGAHIFVRKTHDLEKLKAWHLQQRQENVNHNNYDIDLDSIFNELVLEQEGLQILISSIFSPLITSLHGAAGTSFMADTFGFHRGENVSRSRLIFWVRYGLYRNATLAADEVMPVSIGDAPSHVAKDEYFRYINRCIARL